MVGEGSSRFVSCALRRTVLATSLWDDRDIAVGFVFIPIHHQRFTLKRDRSQFNEAHAGNHADGLAGGTGNLAVQIVLAHVVNSLEKR